MENYQLARLYLSGGTLPDNKPVALANKLRHEEKYAYAAEVYIKYLDTCNSVTERKEILKHLALCFYKDTDLPSSTKFDKAIKYLYEIDDSDSFDSEVFGKLGAAYKYRWYNDNRFESLLHARYFYQKGYEHWKGQHKDFLSTPAQSKDQEQKHALEDKDAGYNAINYAFVLDLMAFVRSNVTSNLPNAQGESADKWREQAKAVRQEIIDYIPKLEKAIVHFNKTQEESDKRRLESWINATLGEAHFGLGEYELAETKYKSYATGSPNKEDPTKNDKPRNWEIKTTARQMLAFAEFFIAQKKQDLARVKKKQDREAIEQVIEKCETASRTCYAALYGVAAGTLPGNTTKGKVGLGLSGGGHRAALFHIGVLAALAERDVLRHVEVLSCVSGGSIAGAYYYLLLKKRLEEKRDASPTVDGKLKKAILEPIDYVELVQQMEKKFLKAVQSNLRMSILKEFWPNCKIFLDKTYSRSVRAAELYEADYYQKITGKPESPEEDPMLMRNLKITPQTETGLDQTFKPKEDNWRRHHKVPTLVLNATSLNTGHNWQFTASWMGEPPANIRPDIDSKPRLRRMYYGEAPKPYDKVRLGTAVGASSCVPALFTPIHFPDLYENQDLHLVDGGVHDNQGIASLLEQECKIIIISDASGQLSTEKISSEDMLGSFWRSDSILQARVRESQFLDLRERRISGQVSALSIVHLTKDLQANPIKWKYCEDPTRQQWLAAHDGDNINRTSYGILQPVQTALAEIRTDLDAFNDAEAYALMYSGYQQTHHDFDAQKLGEIFGAKHAPTLAKAMVEAEALKHAEAPKDGETKPAEGKKAAPRWKFLAIEPYMTIPEKSRWLLPRLELGKKQVFRSVQIITWLRLTLGLFFLLLLIGLVAGFWYYWKSTLLILGVSTIGTLLIFKVLGHIGGPLITKILGWKSFVVEVASAFLLALAVKFYLAWIAPHYLRYGSLPELEKEGSFEPVKRWWRRWVG